MKLERIHVERFGAWQGLDLPVDPAGLSVFYGPNEAGKTTLMRFVRGVLYGFSPDDSGRPVTGDSSRPWGGSVQVQQGPDSLLLRRIGQENSRGLVTARPVDEGSTADDEYEAGALSAALVSNVSETVFDNIFTVGLHELQELATLEADEVAEHIYSLSLGLDGQQLLDQIGEVEAARDEILDPDADTGRLADTWQEVTAIDRQLEQYAGVRKRYEQLVVERGNWEDTIVELKERQYGLEQQFHGHEYMKLAHDPWCKVRDYERELEKLPSLPDFPAQGLSNLQQLQSELAAIRGRRKALRDEARQLKAHAEKIEFDPEFRRYAPALQAFVDQREWIAELIELADHADNQAEELRGQLNQRLMELGDEWSEERLQAVDISHTTGGCLTRRAGEYRSLDARSRNLKRKYRRLSVKFHRRQEQVLRLRQQVGETAIDDAIKQTREELSQLEDLSRLRIRETELTQRKIGLTRQLQRMKIDPTLPQWVYAVFSAMAITGIVIGLIGAVSGLTSNGVAGMAYALLGACCYGLTWALRKHFEGGFEQARRHLQSELDELEKRLEETHMSLAHVAPMISSLRVGEANQQSDPETPTEAPTQADSLIRQVAATRPASEQSEADLVRECLDRLRELEQMVAYEQWVEEKRPALIEMRHRLRDVQRDFGVARQSWCSHLVEQGLDETVDIDEAMTQRDVVGRSALLLQQIGGLEGDAQHARRIVGRFRKRIEEFGHRLQRWDDDYSAPLDILDEWEEELTRLAEARREQRRLRREARVRKRESSKYGARIRRLMAQQDAILVRGGAVSLDEFAERAKLLERRFELQEHLDRAKQELAAVASTDQAMAIVESDLVDYDAQQNEQCLMTIRQELDDVAVDIEDAFENLGRFRRETELLENDSTPARLRFDREQLLSQISGLAEEWFALDWSAHTLEDLRIDFEKNHQPPILSRANEYLQRLSGGRYHNIWTPLGQRSLCVDDIDGNTLMVGNLSSGTREQLFLAIRLALIEHFSNAGVELPVVLDDVLVNFDHERTVAAIEELLRQTRRNQQILFFTCHQHLAEMFRQRGVSTVTLPDRRAGDLLAG
jgi:uncharacterized protein YhaN